MYVNLNIRKNVLTFKLFYLMGVGSCFLVEPTVGIFTLQHPVKTRFAGTSAQLREHLKLSRKNQPQSGSHLS